MQSYDIRIKPHSFLSRRPYSKTLRTPLVVLQNFIAVHTVLIVYKAYMFPSSLL